MASISETTQNFGDANMALRISEGAGVCQTLRAHVALRMRL